MSIEDYMLTDWIPTLVLLGQSNRKYLCLFGGDICIQTEVNHSLFTDENEIEICYLEDGTILGRAKSER